MTRLISLLALSAFTVACSGEGGGDNPDVPDDQARLEGDVSDAQGSDTARFGGSGTASASTEVQAVLVKDNGDLEVLATADLEASGSYAIDVDPMLEGVVVQALDADGNVTASSAVAQVGAAGEVTLVAPMTSETSLEAHVWIEMRAEVGAEANLADIQQRIDARLAASVQASADAEAAAEGVVETMIVAQAAEIEAMAAVGINTTQSALWEAEAEYSAALSAELAGDGNAAEAHASFEAAIRSNLESMGATAEEMSQIEAAASISARLTAQARISDSDVASAMVRAAARTEARASGEALTAIVEGAGAGSEAVNASADAGAELVADVNASTSVSAVADAYAEYQVSIVGNQSVQSSILGQTLELEAAEAIAVQGAVDASLTAAATFDASVRSSTEAALSSAEVDASAVAEAVVSAHATYRGSVDAAFSGVQVLSDTEADVAIALAVEASARAYGSAN